VPDVKLAYIDPKAVLGALAVQKFEPNLGPSGPDEDDNVVEAELAVPGLALSPGAPPFVAAMHYTQVLDQLWPQFDTPEKRTAARLSALLEEVIDEANRVLLLKQDLWELPGFKLPELERKRFDKEFLAYLRRLQEYKATLGDLPDSSTATDSVYIGLVKRRDGAGPVPDAIMHLYFAQQLGILADHAEEMGEGFIGRVMSGIAKADAAIDRAKETVDREKEEFMEDVASWWDQVTRPFKIVGAVLLGTVVVVGGVVVADKLIDRRKPEPEPWT
jgi:hypothetical protein